MNARRILRAAILGALVAGAWTAGTFGPSRAAIVQAPTVRCPAGVSPACASWQDTNTRKVVQDLELFDHNKAPIWWCNNAGGCWVGSDRMGVTGKSVFDNAAYLFAPDGVHGVLVLDGKTLTSKLVLFLACLDTRSTRILRCRAIANREYELLQPFNADVAGPAQRAGGTR